MLAAFAAEQRPEFENPRSAVVSQPAEEAGEEAEVAAKAEPTQSNELNGAPPPPDDEGYVWPEGSAPTEATAATSSSPEEESVPNAPLPSLDELIQRIPPAARETLDELFRVKFVSVKRVEKSALKN